MARGLAGKNTAVQALKPELNPWISLWEERTDSRKSPSDFHMYAVTSTWLCLYALDIHTDKTIVNKKKTFALEHKYDFY